MTHFFTFLAILIAGVFQTAVVPVNLLLLIGFFVLGKAGFFKHNIFGDCFFNKSLQKKMGSAKFLAHISTDIYF
jgi:MFS-type transporter involved in bile tolerance (Atg22 family)